MPAASRRYWKWPRPARNLDPKPKRSILFALWDAEESGLNGSKYWLSKPTLPLADVKLMINMDMVGRLARQQLDGIRRTHGARGCAN